MKNGGFDYVVELQNETLPWSWETIIGDATLDNQSMGTFVKLSTNGSEALLSQHINLNQTEAQSIRFSMASKVVELFIYVTI